MRGPYKPTITANLITGTPDSSKIAASTFAGSAEAGTDSLQIGKNCEFSGKGIIVSQKAQMIGVAEFVIVDFSFWESPARYATFLKEPTGLKKISCQTIADQIYGQ